MLKSHIAELLKSARRFFEPSWAESGNDLAELLRVFLEALLFLPELGFWAEQEQHCSPLQSCRHSSSWVTPKYADQI